MKRKKGCFILIMLLVVLLTQPVGAEYFPFRINRRHNNVKFGTYQPYFDENGRTMVPLCHSHEILQGNMTWSIKGDNITFYQPGWEYSNTVTIQIGSNILIKNGELIEMDTVPVIRNNEIYFPLRAVAEALDHYVDYYEELREIEVIYESAQIYLWNEYEDSSLEGMRYYICQNPKEDKKYEELKENGSSDFDALYKLLASFTDPINMIQFYQIKGHKISKEIDSKIDALSPYKSWSDILVTPLEPIIQEFGEFTNEWYSKQIMALGGKDLKQYEGECYRFTCIPPFWEPVMLTVKVNSDGSGTLHFSMCNNPINVFEGDLLKEEKKELTKKQVDDFLETLKQTDFWNLPKEDDFMVMDGTQLVIEGVKNGQYHILDRCIQQENSVIQAIENAFSKLYEE